MSLPTLTGIARLVADPELRFSASGVAVCSMRLCFSSRKQDPSGQWVDGDEFFVKATAFKSLAEHCAQSLSRGTEVVVTGRLKTEQWQTRDGEKRSTPALLLDSIGPSLRWNTATINRAQRSTVVEPVPAHNGRADDEPPPF